MAGWTRVAVALGVVFGLGTAGVACAEGTAADKVTCQLHRYTTVPISMYRGALLLPVEIQGTKAFLHLQLKSGASIMPAEPGA